MKNSDKSIGDFLFILLVIFVQGYGGIDFSPGIFPLLLLIQIISNKFKFDRYSFLLFLLLYLISLYSLSNSLFNQTFETNIIFRYLRVVLSFLVIKFYFNIDRVNTKRYLDIILFILFVHAALILIQIVYPKSFHLISSFNGYSAKYLRYRASGLFTGYDYAGLFNNIGLFLSGYSYIQLNRKHYLFYNLIFIVASFFTSRVNFFLTVGTLVILWVNSFIYKKRVMGTIYTFILFLCGMALAILFLFSFNSLNSIKEIVTSKYTSLSILNNFSDTYAKYSLNEVLDEQVKTPLSQEFILGIARGSGTDPGYTNIIYSIGYVGLFLVLFFYLILLMKIFLSRKRISTGIQRVIFVNIFYIMIIVILMEIKLSFLFGSGIFELQIFLYFLYNHEVNEGLSKRNIDLTDKKYNFIG